MLNMRNMLKKPEFHVFFFAVCFVLLCLPFLIFRNASDRINMFAMDLFLYFFILWGIIIIFLVLITRGLRNDKPRPPANEHDGDRNV